MTERRTRRPGFTLLEMVVVLSSLLMVMMLIAAVLVGALRIQEQALRTSGRLIAHGELADQFRGDVARAATAPKKFGGDSAGPACLILRMSDGKHVVYRWRDDRLQLVQEVGGVNSERTLPLGAARTAVEFDHADDGRLLTLRLIERPQRGGENKVIEFAAALGGDIR